MAPHFSTLAWKIPWTEEPGRLQSMEWLRVGHDWATSLSLFTFMHWRRKWQLTPMFLSGESQGWRSLVGCHLRDHTESGSHDWSDLAVLSWREEKGETLTHSGSSYWGSVSSGAFGTHQRETMARDPQLLPQHSPVLRGSLGERRSEEVGKKTPSRLMGHKNCHGVGTSWKRISRQQTEWEGNKVY